MNKLKGDSMDKELMQQNAKDHLWMHFTRMGTYTNQDVPIITHGEGCYGPKEIETHGSSKRHD